MDRTTQREKGRRGLFQRIITAIGASAQSRKRNRGEPLFDLLFFAVAFLFARCHIIFGAFPLAVAFIAALPYRVWVGAAGAVLGALTLGKYGIIYAMISAIVVFLRIIVSSGETKESGVPRLFSESLLLRVCSALIGGFVAAVYEILLSGFSLAAVAFGLSMTLLPPLLCFVASGLFDTKIRLRDIFLDKTPVFSRRFLGESERHEALFFRIAALVFCFLISLSLREYELFGIGAAHIFTAVITLFAARRFGGISGAAVGFSAALGLSGYAAAAFALSGLAAGVLFRVGIIYALVGGGAALCLFSAYSGGLMGLLSVLPEYSVGAMLSIPLIRRTSLERREEEIEDGVRAAEDMVGTMSLAHKSRTYTAADSVIRSLASLSSSVRRRAAEEMKPRRDELSDLVYECERRYCDGCDSACEECLSLGGAVKIMPDSDETALKILRRGKIDREDLRGSDSPCKRSAEIAATVNRASAILAEKKYKAAAKNGSAETLELAARLVGEARECDERQRSEDEAASAELTELLSHYGMTGGIARVFGRRQRHIILAAEDEDGSHISSSDFLRAVESQLGASLTTPEFFRRGKMALLECDTTKRYAAECAFAAETGEREDISGDTARAFESPDGSFFALISDGMGSGEEAKATSELVSELLFGGLCFSEGKETTVKLINNLLLSRPGECSATVDLFSLDLYLGEACFIKSGAAASFIKRARTDGGNSLFRIRSSSAPAGLMREVDAERIRVEIEHDDYIIMLSDGVTDGSEDSPWLIELLSGAVHGGVREYADYILKGARANSKGTDDMTVLVVKVRKI